VLKYLCPIPEEDVPVGNPTRPGSAPPAHDVLSGLLGPVIRQAGADLEGIEVRPAGSHRLVRVVIDKDGGVDLDAVAQVSAAVSAALDGAEVLGDGPYTLEVTSPGVDRPLVLPRHWSRARGRLVRVRTTEREVLGRLDTCDDASFTLRTDAGVVTIEYAAVDHANVEVEFTRGPES
jgi:ribosome maturation factor RimP